MDKISKKILQKYKHIAFDLDGTLVHTLPEYRHKIVPNVVHQLSGQVSSLRAVDLGREIDFYINVLIF